ncbi:hypothetical protein D5S17_09510 [Pseudonocardiaceae bacterium YIM PH 21723]|nr:hypothetical protein D5S17_09510 [Pseudonocardiaceae bacterium YIM PH 21723]
MQVDLVCAIHQPNLFPRLSTLAKLLAADVWIVLDDVQFNSRDYQHRARLAAPGQPAPSQWLSLPVYRPRGRNTAINEVVLLEPTKSSRRLTGLLQQHYGRSRFWPEVRAVAYELAKIVGNGGRLAEITEESTRALLQLLNWRGMVIRSSELAVRGERSARLADLALAVGADRYLCGPGGAKYLSTQPFNEYGIEVGYPAPPSRTAWQANRGVSTLHWVAEIGFAELRQGLLGAEQPVGWRSMTATR